MYKKISQETLQTLRETANDKIEFVLSALGIDVDSSFGFGDEIRLPCPVHCGDNPSAFCYNTTYSNWKCFTNSCHTEYYGDIFSLVRLIQRNTEGHEIHFVDAVKWLAGLLEISIEEEKENVDSDKQELTKLVLEAKRKNKLHGRTKSANQKEKFEPFPIGLVKDKIQISQYFLDQGFSEEILKKYNVGYCTDPYKPMYQRSYAPVLDEKGEMVIGVTGRIKFEKCNLCGDFHEQTNQGCPRDNKLVRAYSKWQHYGFSVTSVLYNSWFAEKYIRETGTAILTEGPKEVWWLEQHNIHNSGCIFGLNLYDYHINKLLSLNTMTVVVALDNDERGIEAAEKLSDKIGMYFKIVNLKHLLNPNEDIDEISTDKMHKVVIPYLESLYRK
jgi:DNA primase